MSKVQVYFIAANDCIGKMDLFLALIVVHPRKEAFDSSQSIDLIIQLNLHFIKSFESYPSLTPSPGNDVLTNEATFAYQ